MTWTFQTSDGRIIARIILLAHRFGCEYTSLSVNKNGDVFAVEIALTGPELQLRRLDAQIAKLLDYEKEMF